jgi:2-polyprenyl-3-methyl-5-hydroxy-6-metoxy-1,4-benzoquinol methylase
MNIDSPEEIFDGSWHYFCRRIDQVGFALDKKFDMISALEVLEHMIDTDAFLEECRNHLASAGWLIITTPNINSLRNRVTVPLGTYPNGIEYRTVIHHVRLYNAANLKSHVESHGFRLVKMSGVSFLPRRTLVGVTVKGIDHQLSKLLPSLCGNLIGVFQKLD